MADNRKFFDIWIVEIQKVYRDVPYDVVVDWVQQGRLLEDDRIRPTGTPNWMRVADFLAITPFLPKPELHRAEDKAEALEPVEVDIRYKKAHEEDDDEVDMIPLIDVSLVLLVFFMLNAAGGASPLFIPVPVTQYSSTVTTPEGVMLGIDLKDEAGAKVASYSMGEGSNPPAAEDRDLRSLQELLNRLDAKLAASEHPWVVTVNAHEDVEAGVVRDLIAALDAPQRKPRILKKFIGVTEEAS